jgi:hypothetical protein
MHHFDGLRGTLFLLIKKKRLERGVYLDIQRITGHHTGDTALSSVSFP